MGYEYFDFIEDREKVKETWDCQAKLKLKLIRYGEIC